MQSAIQLNSTSLQRACIPQAHCMYIASAMNVLCKCSTVKSLLDRTVVAILPLLVPLPYTKQCIWLPWYMVYGALNGYTTYSQKRGQHIICDLRRVTMVTPIYAIPTAAMGDTIQPVTRSHSVLPCYLTLTPSLLSISRWLLSVSNEE